MPPDNADDDTGPIRRVPPSAAGRRRPGPPPGRRPPAPAADRAGPTHQRDSPPRRESAHRPATPADAVRGHGHGHGHAHGPPAPSSPRVRKLLTVLLVPFLLASIAGVVLLYPWGETDPSGTSDTPVHGDVVAVESSPCLDPGEVRVGEEEPAPDEPECLSVKVRLADGPAAGQTLTKAVPVEPSTPRFTVDDAVVLSYNGADAGAPDSYQLVDFQRGLPLTILAGFFALAVIALGRWQGLAALIALGLSFAVLVLFVLPSILAGENPLLVAIAGAGLIMFVALYLTHGISARTSAAVLGTMVSLALIGILSAVFSAAAALTGLGDDTATLMASLGHSIDARGLLLAGMVIGALGVLDDVTVTQTSAVWELRRANPSMGWRALYGAGLRIGRDHVASAVNTLVMAYAGAALPVLLYSSISGVGFGSILGSQDIAQEIVRTLAGSIGIVAAVPVTTALAAVIASREPTAVEEPAADA